MLPAMRLSRVLVLSLVFLWAGHGMGQALASTASTAAAQWEKLIEANRIAQASRLCTAWIRSSGHEKQVEAQKCLANVALARGSQLSLEGNEVGGGTLGTGYTTEAVDEALVHLNEGIRLAPQDVSLHEGRLHVLEVAGRYDEMAKALDQSITIYKGPGTPNIWLAYAAELAEAGEPTAGLKISEVLLKHYPNNSDVIGNVGAFYDMRKQWDKGLPYLRRAVELNPADAIDSWNLGWALDQTNQIDEADEWMSKSLQLKSDPNDLNERKCLYGQFLATKRNDLPKGCALVRSSCEADNQKVCEKRSAPALH